MIRKAVLSLIVALPLGLALAPSADAASSSKTHSRLECTNQGGSCKSNDDCCNYSCQWDNDKQKYRCDK